MIIAITAIEDITTVLQKIEVGSHVHYQVVKIQKEGDRANVFFDQCYPSLIDATIMYLDCVANEIALHTDVGLFNNRVITIEIPEF